MDSYFVFVSVLHWLEISYIHENIHEGNTISSLFYRFTRRKRSPKQTQLNVEVLAAF